MVDFEYGQKDESMKKLGLMVLLCALCATASAQSKKYPLTRSIFQTNTASNFRWCA